MVASQNNSLFVVIHMDAGAQNDEARGSKTELGLKTKSRGPKKTTFDRIFDHETELIEHHMT